MVDILGCLPSKAQENMIENEETSKETISGETVPDEIHHPHHLQPNLTPLMLPLPIVCEIWYT